MELKYLPRIFCEEHLNEDMNKDEILDVSFSWKNQTYWISSLEDDQLNELVDDDDAEEMNNVGF